MANDIIFQSTQENVREFVKNRDLYKLMQLYVYIVTDIALNRPPTEFEKEFIKEFFTNDGWAEHINNRKYGTDKLFVLRDKFDLPMISSVLAYEIIKMSMEVYKPLTDKLKQVEKLKGVLESDLDNAVFDGVFDKVEGFSNIYETLIAFEMVKERED